MVRKETSGGYLKRWSLFASVGATSRSGKPVMALRPMVQGNHSFYVFETYEENADTEFERQRLSATIEEFETKCAERGIGLYRNRDIIVQLERKYSARELQFDREVRIQVLDYGSKRFNEIVLLVHRDQYGSWWVVDPQ
jgi:hypothetical protein